MAIRNGVLIDRAAVLLNNHRQNPSPSLEITMSDVPHDGGSPVVRNVLMVAGVVYLIGTVIFMVMAQGRMNDMEKKQAAAQAELAKKMTDSNAQIKASLNVLADRAGMNHKELSKK